MFDNTTPAEPRRPMTDIEVVQSQRNQAQAAVSDLQVVVHLHGVRIKELEDENIRLRAEIAAYKPASAPASAGAS
jgi:hypothetical protein